MKIIVTSLLKDFKLSVYIFKYYVFENLNDSGKILENNSKRVLQNIISMLNICILWNLYLLIILLLSMPSPALGTRNPEILHRCLCEHEIK